MAQARRDLENAKYEAKGRFFEWACFLCQQSAEKAVKAVYQRTGAEAYGHSVSGLLSRLSLIDSTNDSEKPIDLQKKSELVALAKELDKNYIAARYPNTHPEGAPFAMYTEPEADRSIEYAERIIRFCEDLLSRI